MENQETKQHQYNNISTTVRTTITGWKMISLPLCRTTQTKLPQPYEATTIVTSLQKSTRNTSLSRPDHVRSYANLHKSEHRALSRSAFCDTATSNAPVLISSRTPFFVCFSFFFFWTLTKKSSREKNKTKPGQISTTSMTQKNVNRMSLRSSAHRFEGFFFTLLNSRAHWRLP